MSKIFTPANIGNLELSNRLVRSATAERMVVWIWQRLAPDLPGLDRIVVQETCNAGCSYGGPGG